MSTLPIAVQLFSLREDLGRDLEGTLRRVAQAGYTGVELYSYDRYWDRSATELRALLDAVGLKAVSIHIDMDTLAGDAEAALTFARDLDCRFAGFPYLPEDKRGGAEFYRTLGQSLSTYGAIAKTLGLSFFYHNHDFEFATFEGRYALDILLEAADPEFVGSELDVYWAKFAGLDPVAYIRTLGRRCVLLHLKDMAAGAERRFAEVGEGVLDMDGIVAAGQEVGVQYYVVEQDRAYDRTPLEAIALSMKNMKAKGWA